MKNELESVLKSLKVCSCIEGSCKNCDFYDSAPCRDDLMRTAIEVIEGLVPFAPAQMKKVKSNQTGGLIMAGSSKTPEELEKMLQESGLKERADRQRVIYISEEMEKTATAISMDKIVTVCVKPKGSKMALTIEALDAIFVEVYVDSFEKGCNIIESIFGKKTETIKWIPCDSDGMCRIGIKG